MNKFREYSRNFKKDDFVAIPDVTADHSRNFKNEQVQNILRILRTNKFRFVAIPGMRVMRQQIILGILRMDKFGSEYSRNFKNEQVT